jgi:hypothetical protein
MPRNYDDALYDDIAAVLGIEAEDGKYPFTVKDSILEKNLYLIHYDNDDSRLSSKESMVRELRGIIVDMSSKKVVCSSFGYVPTVVEDSEENITKIFNKEVSMEDKDGAEYSFDEFEEGYDAISGEGKMYDVFPLYEGTMLRVWKHNGEMMVSSHKKIDCSNSHWGSSEKFRKLFMEYTEGYDLDSNTEEGNVHYFIMIDQDLLVSSKFPLGGRNGVVVYAGTRTKVNTNCSSGSWTLHTKLSLPSMKDYFSPDNATKTFFGPHFLTSTSDILNVLTRGFHSDSFDQTNPCCMGEGVVLGFNKNGKRSHIRIISSSFKRRSDIVSNDPNILHRAYTILTRTLFPKSGEDTYLRDFPPIPVLSDETIKNMTTPITGVIENGTVYSADELTDKTNPAVFEKRFRNAMTWYAMSLAIPNQLSSFRLIPYVLSEREKVIKILTTNFDKFVIGDFEDFALKNDPNTAKHIQHRLTEAEKFARANSKKDSPPSFIRKLTMKNVRTGILRDTGEWVFKIARFLIPDRYSDKSEAS